MASEPEKKIEELLRGFARKRRDEAGDSVELHPATRRMLQGEVAKLRASRNRAAQSRWKWLFPAWPRFAAAVGMFAVIGVGIWVLTQSEGRISREVAELAASPPAAAVGDDVTPRRDEFESLPKVDQLSAADDAAAGEAGKKIAQAKPRVATLGEAKSQLRDAENSPASDALARSDSIVRNERMLERNVLLGYDLQNGAVAPAEPSRRFGADRDKALEEDSVLLRQKSAETRYYRESDSRSVKLNDFVSKESLDVGATGFTLVPEVATKPSDGSSYSFANTDVYSSFAKEQLAFTFTNVLPGLTPATTAQPDAGVIFANSEWAAAERQNSSKNEEARSLKAHAGAFGREFVRQDAAGVPVLQKFDLEVTNGKVRINDADGSVYEGDVLARAESAPQFKDNGDVTRRGVRMRAAPPSTAAITFRASGTNKLRQRVVIDGEILEEAEPSSQGFAESKVISGPAGAVAPVPPTTPSPSAPQPTTTPQSQAPAVAAPQRASGVAGRETISGSAGAASPFTPMTVRGRLQVGSTNQVNFRAIRAR